MTNPDRTLVQQAQEAFARGDFDALSNQFDESISWHISGIGPLAGDYEGITEVRGLLGKIAGLSGGTARLELHDVLASDDHIVSLVTFSAEREGRRYQGNLVHIIHSQNGKVTEIWTHASDPSGIAEFWS